mmetsp:Transcript_27895/g.53079  ORF Transcript_27895/g.53079 Transcript_27895/m.53079 type:complete len:280 (+) Transcript_27895:1415-2254(+)
MRQSRTCARLLHRLVVCLLLPHKVLHAVIAHHRHHLPRKLVQIILRRLRQGGALLLLALLARRHQAHAPRLRLEGFACALHLDDVRGVLVLGDRVHFDDARSLALLPELSQALAHRHHVPNLKARRGGVHGAVQVAPRIPSAGDVCASLVPEAVAHVPVHHQPLRRRPPHGAVSLVLRVVVEHGPAAALVGVRQQAGVGHLGVGLGLDVQPVGLVDAGPGDEEAGRPVVHVPKALGAPPPAGAARCQCPRTYKLHAPTYSHHHLKAHYQQRHQLHTSHV